MAWSRLTHPSCPLVRGLLAVALLLSVASIAGCGDDAASGASPAAAAGPPGTVASWDAGPSVDSSNTVAAPVFNPAQGRYANDVDVELSSNTAGATVCYTLDQTWPVCNTADRCAGGSVAFVPGTPIGVMDSNTQIHAIACGKGMIPSSRAMASYSFGAAKPTFDPPPEGFDASHPVPVTVSTATQEGVIHYTLDGSQPDCNSPLIFTNTGTFPAFTADTTIRALTCKDKYAASEVVSITYLGAVCIGNFNIATRAALAALARCHEITGYLSIGGNEITDLAPLGHLAQVDGALDVRSAGALTSLHGLEALTSVGGELGILGNPVLTQLDAFSALQTVGGSFLVGGNAITEWLGPSTLVSVGALDIEGETKLQHVGGFSALTQIKGNFSIQDDRVLSTIDGMASLTSISGTMTFAGDDALVGVSGFDNVNSLGGLAVASNGALTHFFAFSAITTIPGGLSITRNPNLSAIDLTHLQTVDGGVSVGDGLPALTSLEGLSGLTTIGVLGITGEVGFTHPSGLEHLTTATHGVLIERTTKLVDLTGLDNLTSGGELRIENNVDLQSLRGLDKLGSTANLDGGISISSNGALTEIGGLGAVTHVASQIGIVGNPKLAQLDGLHHLQSVGNLYMTQNAALTNLRGFEALAHATGSLAILGNDLTSVQEFHSLTTVDGEIEVALEPSLTTLAGLGSLTTIGNSLLIENCPALPDLTGLGALQSIGGALGIIRNQVLTRVDALTQLVKLGANLYIYGNPSLPPCQADGVVAKLRAAGYKGSTDTTGNGGTGTCN